MIISYKRGEETRDRTGLQLAPHSSALDTPTETGRSAVLDPLVYRAGAETQVNTTTADHQEVAAVAALSDGGYVITWAS
ncbi:hypothetical protein ABI_39880 [Asticcacaulis biprosthecium C19]|uniref:Uncharacterized protein n=1 Tax=Asticcacaulis biprosthecium C19 TaxID=715226 RepID=F4QS51_9CAUL|nr:hypothetical protein [Asticcacaulis biprosthecium]EGF89571.1 hypothetical protein ABI_39880 [Asticcacaulis biprosthecium C19]